MISASRFLSALASLVLLAASLPAAHADSYFYDFTLSAFSSTYSFTYTSPYLITAADVTFVPSTCTYRAAATCTTAEINDVTQNGFVTINSTSGGSITAFNLPSSYFTVGTHTGNSGASQFAITDIPAAVTPEPSTLALLGTGLIGAFGVARRKFRAS